MSIETIAKRLARAGDFVEVAIEVCRLTRELHGIDQCAICLQAPDNRPLLAVDNMTMPDVEPRLGWFTSGWRQDPLHLVTTPVSDDDVVGQSRFMRIMRDHGYPGAAGYTLALPLLYPRGLLGQIRCISASPYDLELRRELTMLATAVSVRLTELRVTPDRSPVFDKLTPRQRDVALLAARGQSTLDIGRTLQLSPNTVKKHLKDVFEALEVASRVQLAAVVGMCGPDHDYPVGVSRIAEITILCAAA